MKIRLDFVTNSSSSSFICFAQKCRLEDVIAVKGVSPTGGKYILLGDYLCEGRDHIELDLEKSELFKDLIDSGLASEYFTPDILHVLDEGWDSYDMIVRPASFEKALLGYGKIHAISCDVDYHSNGTIEEIKDHYVQSD